MAEYIERDALRQAVLESQHDNSHPRGWAHIAHDCEHAHFVAMIARFPAADVAAVVHGCFEPCFDENGNWRQGFAKCSNCGKEYYAQGVSLLTCPARLYGTAAKLCNMECLCEDVYRAKDAELTLDALQELVDKGLGGRFIDLRKALKGVEL